MASITANTIDSKNNIVVNVRITPANVNDIDPVLEILNDMEKRLVHCPLIWALTRDTTTLPPITRLLPAAFSRSLGTAGIPTKMSALRNTVSYTRKTETFTFVHKNRS